MRTYILRKIANMNYTLLFLISLLVTIGFFVLYSAAGGNVDPWMNKQALRFLIGMIILTTIALIDIRFWLQSAYFLYLIAFILLLAVETIGLIGMGAQRWINLYFFHVQPSELMKITLILALARYFHVVSLQDLKNPITLLIPSIMIFVPALLVLRQPDLGTAMIFILSGAAMFFFAGVRWWVFAASLTGALASLPIFWTFLRDYQKNRILTFFNPERDPLGSGYHILQSKIALGSGGLWGKGFLQGTQSHLNFLPEKQTDFIFTMLCEEFGMVGGGTLILIYGILIGYSYTVCLRLSNHFGRLLGLGVTTILFLYAFINIAMVMELLPVVGVPLPFISYGGTSLLTLLIGFGFLMSAVIQHAMKHR